MSVENLLTDPKFLLFSYNILPKTFEKMTDVMPGALH